MDADKAFTTLIKDHENLIYKVARLYTHHIEDRDDLFQEIVIQLWKAFQKFQNRSKVSTWIYRIALNTAITGVRKRKGLMWVPFEQANLSYSEMKSEPQDDQIELLYEYIKDLNVLDKGVILLYLEDKSYKEISETVGISETNVGTRISRIRQKMKSKVNNQ